MSASLKSLIATMLSLLLSTAAQAQYSHLMHDHYASLEVTAGTRWTDLPLIYLGESERIFVNFDELSHTHRRLRYAVVHCEDDWSPSEGLFETDYIDGFGSDLPIDDIEESELTNTQYTHYQFSLPNDRCRLKMSGNYEVVVTDDDTGEPVATVCFMVTERTATVGLSATPNTDIDTRHNHQQVEATVQLGSLNVTNAHDQLRLVVMQNGRWDNAVWAPRANFVTTTAMQWTHNRQLIFDAGNVYRRFEMLDMTHPTMGIERMAWDGNGYHAYVMADEPRPNYVHDEGPQGAFTVRNSDNESVNTLSDYGLVHFTLVTPRLSGRVFLQGWWTAGATTTDFELTYDDQQQAYTATIPLKQGFYSYQYMWQKPSGDVVTVPSEGSFWQTRNSYQALAYYRGAADRTWRLVGHATTEATY